MLVLLFSLLLFCGTSQGKLYKLIIETADTFGAGTDAEIRIRIQGTKDNVQERVIHGSFEQDRTDRIDVNDYDIGLITGMDIRRDESGHFPKWKLDKITIKVSGAVDSIFKYYGWVDPKKWIKLPLSCPSGYGVNAQGYCDFVDQCTQPGRCNTVTSTCENLPGDYRCICKSGYQNSDPKTCINVNECNLGTDNCDKATSTCADSEGSFYCRCKDGYTHGANNKICEDIDECKQSKCDYITSTCENLPGDYRCICRQGYQNINSKTCKNINECDLGTDTCDKATSTCEDNGGSFFCRCKDGYTQGANNKICQAIKCGPVSVPATSIMTPARCTQLDANVFGDKCVMTCKDGYVIDDIQHGTLTCGSSGRWEGNMGTCNPVQCPALPAIAYGKIHPLTCTTSGGSYPYTCTYSCVSGYMLAGQATRQCQKDKTWAGVAPTCRQIVVQPWISCPGNIIQDLAPGQGTADVSAVWKLPTSNVQQITINPPEISNSYRFPPGMTKVDWTATNSAGSASCSMYVIISDKEAPKVVSCPSDIYEISDVPKAMTWTEPTFSDNVKVTKVEQTFNSGYTFPIGPTKVKYDASDAAGNRISCEFTVTLKRPACYDPDGPVGGTKTCNAVGSSSLCSWNCPSGSNLYKLPPNIYFWSCNNGVWTPSDTLPECVVSSKKDPNTPCEEGRIEMTVYSLFEGTSVHCAKCPSGTHKSSKDDCSPCPAGTYNDQQGQMQCTQQCPSGTSSLPGARSAEECKPPCPAGKISADGLGPNCQDCPRDTYQDKAQQKSCITCPIGTTTVAKGSSSPNHCGVKPNISPAPQEVTINEKETATVDCYASGKPTPTFKWKFLRDIPADFLGTMSQESLKDANQNVIGSRLTITKATVENTGSYECVVTNSHGSDMALAKINVNPVINNQEGSGSQPI